MNWEDIRRVVLERDGFSCVECTVRLTSAEADVHHLLPRSMGGSDEPSNLVTLCDGCHAAHHPNLAGGLARRVIEKWATRLARWLDTAGNIPAEKSNFGPALRLFGLQRFRQGQLPIVLAALAGKSILVVSPTGSGKTLCFQLPAMLREGVAIVVSPLKSLMSEQVSDLLRKRIPASFINSDLSTEERALRFGFLTRKALKLLYVAPERFFVRSSEERDRLKTSGPSYLVIDEAHCVDQWGRDFRPEYGRLREVREKLGSPPVLAFTATAGRDMQERILESLGIQDAMIFVRDVDRPNIGLFRWPCSVENRSSTIAELLSTTGVAAQKVMIFVPSVRVGNDLSSALKEKGIEIPFYHSRFGSPWERQELLKRFTGQSEPPLQHIICTNAFGMGLDIPNVRLVIHWQHPSSVEDLLQEFGRAGRDGAPSAAVILYDKKRPSRDTKRLAFMAEKTAEMAPPLDRSRVLSRRMTQLGQVSAMINSRTCFRQMIRDYFEADGARSSASLSERILEWVFGTGSKKHRITTCCDFCDAERSHGVGRRAYVTRIVCGG